MALFLISYDLTKKDEEHYKPLYALLERWKAKRVLKSAWKLRVENSSCKDIGNALVKTIEANDRLVVTEVSDWAEFNPLVTMKGN